MAAKYTALALALAACFIMAAAKKSACDDRAMDNLEKQIEICARNVPAQMYSDPTWQCAREVSGKLNRKGANCNINDAPTYLENCLYGYAGDDDVAPAVDCLTNALSAKICC
ncbi:uncharacterized protein LOC117650653 [Thrips palmi]|uniref:Uncharacterized protein LOC117650653 n=1 Tax=Thrips palmi TaxID=161013 RepID=A0A6P8ZYD5_THRPL|nr:uncharacterized protein LOC117650653 [Thrips palmi]